MNETFDTINVSVGPFEVTYHIAQTRAPKAYDGFGTLELADYGKETGRLILIREEHLNWQIGRNDSGRYATFKPDYAPIEVIAEEIWKRIRGDTEK